MIYDHTNQKEIQKELPDLLQTTVYQLCQYLKKENKKVEILKCYDSQSGWHGKDVMIGRANLAINGYCLSNKSVLDFINGKIGKRYYSLCDPEHKELKNW